MLSAVHTDRSGRVLVSGDYFAAGSDGASIVPLRDTVALPENARLVPIERDAEGFDRAGRPRLLAHGRWTLAAVLPSGFVRTHNPAYREAPSDPPLDPLPYAAIAADEHGALRVAALQTGAADGTAVADLEPAIRDELRGHPSNTLARQLARCARDYGCAAARGAFAGRGLAAVTVASPDPATADAERKVIAPRWRPDESPTERAAFRPTSAEIAEIALAHIARGGTGVSFGRACEGEPLGSVRLIEEAIRRIRESTDRGRIHLETGGASAAALRRLAAVGLGAVTVRVVTARADTHDALHGSVDHRWPDVRATLQAAAELGLDLEIALLVFPGITDRPVELDEFTALLRDLPNASVMPRDLAADPHRALDLLPSRGSPIGVAAALERIRREAPRALRDVPAPVA